MAAGSRGGLQCMRARRLQGQTCELRRVAMPSGLTRVSNCGGTTCTCLLRPLNSLRIHCTLTRSARLAPWRRTMCGLTGIAVAPPLSNPPPEHSAVAHRPPPLIQLGLPLLIQLGLPPCSAGYSSSWGSPGAVRVGLCACRPPGFPAQARCCSKAMARRRRVRAATVVGPAPDVRVAKVTASVLCGCVCSCGHTADAPSASRRGI